MLALASPLSLLVGVGNNQAGTHYKTFSADKASPNARFQDTLEYGAENVGVAEPLVACTRERGMVRNLVFD